MKITGHIQLTAALEIDTDEAQILNWLCCKAFYDWCKEKYHPPEFNMKESEVSEILTQLREETQKFLDIQE